MAKMNSSQVSGATPVRSGRSIDEILTEIAALPADWHKAGTMSERVLRAMAHHAKGREILASAETGSGKTTLLFSHLSRNHKVFAADCNNRSVTVVRESPLFNETSVEFILGSTQITLPQHKFEQKLQMVLLDGPHGYPFPDLEYYFVYPHLDSNALLIVDDIQIPTIYRMFEILKEDEMFRLLEVVETTAFFQRTDAPLFDPEGDGWWIQEFNKKRFPISLPVSKKERLRRLVARNLPQPVKRALKRRLNRH